MSRTRQNGGAIKALKGLETPARMEENGVGKKDGVNSFPPTPRNFGPEGTRGIHMNTRERFLAVLDFNKDVHSLKWDFGIWGEAVDNWYAQGLPKKNYPVLSKTLTTPTRSEERRVGKECRSRWS